MPGTHPDLFALLEVLAEHQVDFIVIGGVGAVLQGAPIATFDLDVVHSRDASNLGRLLSALTALGAYYRGHGERNPPPTLSNLAGPGHHLLMTRAGPLDLLGAVTKGRVYADLLEETIDMVIRPGLSVKVLDLAMIITLKEELGGEKDLAALPVLRRTLEERRRGS